MAFAWDQGETGLGLGDLARARAAGYSDDEIRLGWLDAGRRVGPGAFSALFSNASAPPPSGGADPDGPTGVETVGKDGTTYGWNPTGTALFNPDLTSRYTDLVWDDASPINDASEAYRTGGSGSGGERLSGSSGGGGDRNSAEGESDMLAWRELFDANRGSAVMKDYLARQPRSGTTRMAGEALAGLIDV